MKYKSSTVTSWVHVNVSGAAICLSVCTPSHQLKVCNTALAFGSAFKSLFDCQVSWHDGCKASPFRKGYMGSAKHHYHLDFLKAKEAFSWPNKSPIGFYHNLTVQS